MATGSASGNLAFNYYILDVRDERLVGPDGPVQLGNKAFRVLHMLVQQRGKLLTKDALFDSVWDGTTVSESALTSVIKELRRALGDEPKSPRFIESVYGRGYRFLSPVDTVPEENEIISPVRKGALAETVLAVLPFDNLSSDLEMDFFSDGVSEEILGRIIRGSQIQAIGRTSSFKFRGVEKAGAATALQATHVLDGSIRRSGNRVRISAHLIDATGRATLWSDRYDRSLTDIFSVQDEIAESIAEALHATFLPRKAESIDPVLYDLYLRARTLRLDSLAMTQNIASLDRITRLAPDFAAAWGTLAFFRTLTVMQLPYAVRGRLKALAADDVARCLQIDRDNPEAISAKFFAAAPFGTFLEQEAAFNSAATQRSSAELLATRAYFSASVGRMREAVDLTERAVAYDALNAFAMGTWGQMLWRAGDVERGRSVMEQALRQSPEDHHSAASLIVAHGVAGNWNAVDRLTNPARLVVHPLREHQFVLNRVALLRNPTPENRQRVFDEAVAIGGRPGYLEAQRAVAAAETGLIDETFALLDCVRLSPAGAPGDLLGTNAYRTLLLFQQPFSALRSDPRFVRLCARLGLVDYWFATDKWPDCVGAVDYDFVAECQKVRDLPKEPFGF